MMLDILTTTIFFLGYQSRFDELRYRYNEVHGEMADNSNLTFSPYVQTRDFKCCLPSLNPQF